MNWKQTFLLGIATSLLSSLTSIIYLTMYKEALIVNFSKVAGIPNIIAACFIGCLLMAIGYQLALKWKGSKTISWVNILYGFLSFVSIVGVFSFGLPMDTESPELFPGLMIPMHFFPLLSILLLSPFFKLNNHDNN